MQELSQNNQNVYTDTLDIYVCYATYHQIEITVIIKQQAFKFKKYFYQTFGMSLPLPPQPTGWVWLI